LIVKYLYIMVQHFNLFQFVDSWFNKQFKKPSA